MQTKQGLFLLAICLSWLIIGSFAVQPSCMRVRPGDANYFFSTPTLPNPGLSTCSQVAPSGSLACCKSTYTDAIVAGTDRVQQQLVNGILSNVPQTCSDLFDLLACVYCSPEQGSVLSASGGSVDMLKVCNSFCERIHDSCASATVVAQNRTVAAAYPQGKDFCNSPEWNSLWFVNVIADAQHEICYDPTASACTEYDYIGEYTLCDPATKTRNVIYHWIPRPDGTFCVPGLVDLPPNKFGLRCDIACEDGKYLPLGMEVCADCQPGTYSIGGGVRYTWWGEEGSSWPETPFLRFNTYSMDVLTGQPKGEGWTKHGTYISSGNNTGVDNIESVLEIQVTLVRAGHVAFEFKVDSEVGFDGMRFEDGQRRVFVSTFSPQFELFTFNLTAGPHTLKWVYFKDFLLASGQDRAFLTSIEIEGTSWADDECLTCPLGTFNPRTGASACIPCTTIGFIPSGDPPTTCKTCPPDQYSLPYDWECRPKPACTADDYEMVFSECQPPLPGTRTKSYVWKNPHFCNEATITLPSTETGLTCANCSLGEHRVASAKCDYCPDGTTSRAPDFECVNCGPREVGIKSQIFTTFAQRAMPTGWLTGCDHCDSGGFRIHYDHFDSGDGEGLFTSWLMINRTFYTPGEMRLNYTMYCPAYDCSVTIWLDNNLIYMDYSRAVPYEFARRVPVATAGDHTFFIDFGRWVPLLSHHDHDDSRAEFPYLEFVGVQPGGAAACTTCPTGSVRSFTGASCNLCQPGFFANNASTYCESCPRDSVSFAPGSAECFKCGYGTTSRQYPQTECNFGSCTVGFNTNPSWPVVFNLSALAKPQGMWGPILDPLSRHQYYINICALDRVNNTCKNADGTPMPTASCQITDRGESRDMGRVPAFLYDVPSDMSEERIVVSYNYGTPCTVNPNQNTGRNPTIPTSRDFVNKILRDDMIIISANLTERDERATVTVYRTTNITIICDPSAGVGSPQAPVGGVEDPFDLCHYDFVWYSIYGCHVCTENDYDWRYTPCENGRRTKTYYWKYSPKRCHSGVNTLPPDQVELCTAKDVLCLDGYHVSPKYDNCTKCPTGNFSVAGGERIDFWTVPNMEKHSIWTWCTKASSDDHDNNCDGGWLPDGLQIYSEGHLTGSAVMYTEKTFIRDSFITFDFTLLTEHFEPFEFLIDDRRVAIWNQTVLFESYSAPFRVGYHTFKWKFSPFLNNERTRQAIIHNIVFNGTRFSSDSCEPCEGPLVADSEGSTACHTCPMNTLYQSRDTCEPCPANKFALPGDSVCRGPFACTRQDWREEFGACVGGKRNTTWVLNTPVLCSGGSRPANRINIPCAPCPAGHFRSQFGQCVTCSRTGEYFDPSKGECRRAAPGKSAVRLLEFFTSSEGTDLVSVPPADASTRHNAEERDMPPGWTTGCAGTCGSPGWRMLGNYTDSGVHFKQAYSWLRYETVLSNAGFVSFTTDTASHLEVGPEVSLEFFIDNVPHHLAYTQGQHSHVFQVTAGRHEFTWVHHQNAESFRGDFRSIVSGLVFIGASTGGFVLHECAAGYYSAGGDDPCHPCPAGQYTDHAGSSQCQPCKAGEFSSEEGSAKCEPCGEGTHPDKESGATECLTNECQFVLDYKDPASGEVLRNHTFDLRPLRDQNVIEVPSHVHKTFYIGICNKIPVSGSPCGRNTYVCEDDVDLHRAYDAGRIISTKARYSHQTRADSPTVSVTGLDFELSHGEDTDCKGHKRKTILHMYCAMGAKPFSRFELDSTKEDEMRSCEFHINVDSEYACPYCTPEDVKAIPGECDGSTRRVTYEALVPCLGVPQSHTESCADVEVNEWAIVIVTGIVVFVCVSLVALAIYFWKKKSSAERNYQLLVAETTAPLEMTTLDEDGDRNGSVN